ADEILVSQIGRKVSNGTFPVHAGSRRCDGARTGIACVNAYVRPVKPACLTERHRDRERLLSGGACGAPDVQPMIRVIAEILRNDPINEGAYLVHLTPEERFLNRQILKEPRPF